jgi:hypothetical protein
LERCASDVRAQNVAGRVLQIEKSVVNSF